MNAERTFAWIEKYCRDGDKPVTLTATELLQLLQLRGESKLEMGHMGPITGRLHNFLALLRACEARDRRAPVDVDPDVWRCASPRLQRELTRGNRIACRGEGLSPQ
jgi:hypothetical protein